MQVGRARVEGCQQGVLNVVSFHRDGRCCLCKRSPRRNERLYLSLHLAAEITDTCFPLYIYLLLAQIDDINQSFLCTIWLRSPHEQQKTILDKIQTRCCEMTKNTANWSDTTCFIVYLMLCTTLLYYCLINECVPRRFSL
jgi:hypothetical protein